jgi:hypothetical protein
MLSKLFSGFNKNSRFQKIKVLFRSYSCFPLYRPFGLAVFVKQRQELLRSLCPYYKNTPPNAGHAAAIRARVCVAITDVNQQSQYSRQF